MVALRACRGVVVWRRVAWRGERGVRVAFGVRGVAWRGVAWRAVACVACVWHVACVALCA